MIPTRTISSYAPSMRIVVAPDKYSGTLSAVEAAQAIAEGWRRQAPDDELALRPMADGGPGFLDVLHEALGGELVAATVRGPLGDPAPAGVLLVDDTAYIESAGACGLHLVSPDRRDPERSSTYGVGELVDAALRTGASRIVVGLGGSATNDAGAGLWAALGATSDGDLAAGALGLRDVTAVDLAPARERIGAVELIVASDVDNPLLGMFGATNVYGPQKGLANDRKLAVDQILDEFVVAALGATPAERRLADEHGAGAAGGLGFGLFALGATRVSGIALVADAVGLADHARWADLVITGEGAYDYSSRSGKVVYGVAEIAGQAVRPCVVLAGRVLVGTREMRAMGVESAYSMVDAVGQDAAMSEPDTSLAALAERVARTWSH
jgi:glycerate 2-kinase